MERIRVAVSGALGRMGSTTCAAVYADDELELAVAVDPGFARAEWLGDTPIDRIGEVPAEGIRRYPTLEEALSDGGVDVVVDFTIPAVVLDNIKTSLRHKIPVVVGTTGLSPVELAEIDKTCGQDAVAVLVAPNFAMGAVLMMEFAKQAAAHFRACEIVELHHDRKLDAPSGTSRLTRNGIIESWDEIGYEKEIPIHSVRLPGLVAHQEVIFGGLGETLTIRHDSLSRESFMPGVVLAIKRIRSFQGLIVGLENVL